MPTAERLNRIETPSGLRIKANFTERTSPTARAGVVALGVGEVLFFGETILGLAVIALGLFADRRGRKGRQIRNGGREVKNNV